jgi:hypothetical protein
MLYFAKYVYVCVRVRIGLAREKCFKQPFVLATLTCIGYFFNDASFKISSVEKHNYFTQSTFK